MDVAAQEITDLVQRILPERPHHLCISATSRYPVPPGLWPNSSPLQYTTYVSEADRGILLTRPYFDIQLEEGRKTNSEIRNKPPSSADAALPSGSLAGASSKGDAKKPVTKMSLKDYQQIKNQKRTTGTPQDTSSKPTPNTNPSESGGIIASDDRQHLPPKPDFHGERKQHPLSDSPRAASVIEVKKRMADNNDSAIRPHKRIRSNTSIGSVSPSAGPSSMLSRRMPDPPSPLNISSRSDERPRPKINGQITQMKQVDRQQDKDDGRDRNRERERAQFQERDSVRDQRRDGDRERGRERGRDRNRAQEDKDRLLDRGHDRHRDREHDADQDLNRRHNRERDKDQERGRHHIDTGRRSPASPSTPKANGHRHRERDRSRSPDKIRKSLAALPPLLSPLHFNPECGSTFTEQSRSAVDSTAKATRKAESFKKSDSPYHIPPLLSPTLPAIIEQELSRLKNESIKKPESKSQLSQEPVDPTPFERKPAQAVDLEIEPDASNDPPQQDSHRTREEAQKDAKQSTAQSSLKPSLIVVIKYKKKNSKRVLQLLALQQTPHKAPVRQAERSASIDNTPSPAQVTKKRPAGTETSLGDLHPPPPRAGSTSFKHPRTVAEKSVSTSRASVAPATPSKSTPMARVTSNNSQVLTPGGSVSHTPRSLERPPAGHGDHSSLNVSDYRQRYDTYAKLGTKLKHDRDAIVRNRMPNGVSKLDGSTALSNLTQAEKKSVAALSLEMVMSYMIAFKSLNQSRHMERRPGDITVWENLWPHLLELRGNTRFFKPLEAMAAQLRATFFEQMLASFVGHDAEAVAVKLMSATKQRIDAWAEVANRVAAVHDSSLKVVVGPWLSIEDTVRIMLPAVRIWSEREKAGWEQELQPPK